MKQHFFKLRTASFILALSGLMITLSVPSFANNKKIEIVSSSTAQPTVTYIGSDDKGSSFLVKLDAASPVNFEVSIKDKSGAVLFSNVFEAASFSKTFKVLNEDGSPLQLAFTIKTLPDGKLHTYTVSTEEKSVTEVAINKVK